MRESESKYYPSGEAVLKHRLRESLTPKGRFRSTAPAYYRANICGRSNRTRLPASFLAAEFSHRFGELSRRRFLSRLCCAPVFVAPCFLLKSLKFRFSDNFGSSFFGERFFGEFSRRLASFGGLASFGNLRQVREFRRVGEKTRRLADRVLFWRPTFFSLFLTKVPPKKKSLLDMFSLLLLCPPEAILDKSRSESPSVFCRCVFIEPMVENNWCGGRRKERSKIGKTRHASFFT